MNGALESGHRVADDLIAHDATVTFGSLTTPVLAWSEKDGTVGLFARPRGMNLQIVFDLASGRGTWTVSGEPGQADGTLTVAGRVPPHSTISPSRKG